MTKIEKFVCGGGKNKRYIGLDILRVISAMVICAFHTIVHLHANYGIFQSVLQMGAVFMTLFFMLSGYVLFVTYSGQNIIEIVNLKKYMLKRIIGIVPMYYMVPLNLSCC